jgi:hypothetical protein
MTSGMPYHPPVTPRRSLHQQQQQVRLGAPRQHGQHNTKAAGAGGKDDGGDNYIMK